MTVRSTDAGLARVVVAAPRGRMDLALPEHLPVAVLLPSLLRHGAEDPVTEAVSARGWVLRRADGAQLDAARTLAAQGVRDGEVLHLVPRRSQWPEPQYDDLVDLIAAGARRSGPAWTAATTRAAGLTGSALVLLLVPGVVLVAGGPWTGPAVAVLLGSVFLVAAGAALSRALGDGVAGAVVAAVAAPYALVGGTLLLAGRLRPGEFGAPQLLLGSVAALVAAVLGHLGVAEARRVFVGAAVAAFGGALSAVLALSGLSGVSATAVVVTLFLLAGPALPLVCVRVANVPMPAVPRDVEDLRASDRLPPVEETVAQVSRAAELLAGSLLGSAVVNVVGAAVLAFSGAAAGMLLAAVVSAAHVLRARLFVARRQRTPVLAGGLLGLAVTVVAAAAVLPGWACYGLLVPALVVAGGLSSAAALVFGRRAPSPYLGRAGDVLDVLLTLASGPIVAAVLGMYQVMRGLAG